MVGSLPSLLDQTVLHHADIDDASFLSDIAALPYVERIILFGSRAGDDFSPFADMDLAIICPQATQAQWLHITEIIEQAFTLLKIDVVRFDTLPEGIFKQQIARHGKTLYHEDHYGS